MSKIDLAGVQPDLPLGIPKGDAWLVQESGGGEYQDFRIRFAVLLSITNAYIRSGRITNPPERALNL